MNPTPLPWLEIAVATPLVLALPVSRIRDRLLALRVCTITCAAALAATFAASAFTSAASASSMAAAPFSRLVRIVRPTLWKNLVSLAKNP